jgi:hypothetical protein
MRRTGLALAALLSAVLVAASATGAGVPPWKAWLCMPGAANDWCSVELTTTIWSADGTHKDVPVSVPSDPPIDCFYAYPTVADDYAGNAPLKVEPPERETAITQAARFSHVCRVSAPLYRQVPGKAGTVRLQRSACTSPTLGHGRPRAVARLPRPLQRRTRCRSDRPFGGGRAPEGPPCRRVRQVPERFHLGDPARR